MTGPMVFSRMRLSANSSTSQLFLGSLQVFTPSPLLTFSDALSDEHAYRPHISGSVVFS